MDKLRAVPFLPWQHVFRAAEAVGAVPERPGGLRVRRRPRHPHRVMAAAPLYTRVVVVGVCMGDDRVRPSLGINKELDVRFSLLYTPAEFRQALHLLADGKVDPRPLVTGTVGLDGAAAAFDALGDPESPRQDPGRSARGGVGHPIRGMRGRVPRLAPLAVVLLALLLAGCPRRRTGRARRTTPAPASPRTT